MFRLLGRRGEIAEEERPQRGLIVEKKKKRERETSAALFLFSPSPILLMEFQRDFLIPAQLQGDRRLLNRPRDGDTDNFAAASSAVVEQSSTDRSSVN